jgi:hypothetical protein
VHLVDDEVLDRQFERSIAFPIEVFRDDAGAVGVWARRVQRRAPDVATADRAGHRVEQDLRRIEAMPLGWGVGSVQAEAILEVVEVKVEDHHGEDVTDAKLGWERDLGHGRRDARLEQDERSGTGVPGVHREVDPARKHGGPKGQGKAGPQRKAGMVVGWVDVDAHHGRGPRRHTGGSRRGLLE